MTGRKETGHTRKDTGYTRKYTIYTRITFKKHAPEMLKAR